MDYKEENMQNTLVKVSSNEGKTQVDVIGSVDENFNQFTKEVPKTGAVEFSLQALKSINSTGIREWIKMMQGMPAAQITFANCPKIFIDQVNMVNGFIPPKSQVVSFYVPYYNEDLDKEALVLYKLGTNFTATTVQVQDHHKDEAGNMYELDVVKAKYFKFIQTV
jgi:hypothetical protein